MYQQGKGVEQDDTQATFWYRKAADEFRQAAEREEANGQFDLGKMYENGHGIAQDETKASHWYHKAAEQGHP